MNEVVIGAIALLCPLAMLILPIVAMARASEARKQAAELAVRLGVVEGRLKDAEARLAGGVVVAVGAPAAPVSASAAAPSEPAAQPASSSAAPSTSPISPDPAAPTPPVSARPASTGRSPTPLHAAVPTSPPPTPKIADAARPAASTPSKAPAGWTPLSAKKGADAKGPPGTSTPAPPKPPTRPPPTPKPAFDLERWIGVRGAAVLGSAILALAGLLLFKYSIDAGLISPALRVVGGTLAGLGCIVAAQTRWLKPYAITANGIAGAGCAALYASFWASHTLYDLVPALIAFGLMGLVTVVCCVLAVRQNSLVIALLGLVGGFMTPLLVSTDVENPLGRFAYILLLDVGLLVLAKKRGWTVLAVLSLVGTVAYQALWVAADMSPGDLGVGLVILGVFAGVFAFAGRGSGGGMRTTQAAALLVPTGFSLYFSLQGPVDGDLWSHGMLLLLLNGAGAWLAREQDSPMLAVGIAAASLPPVAAWMLHADADTAAQFQAAVVMLLIAAIHHGVAELAAKKGGGAAGAPVAAVLAAVVAALGLGAMPLGSTIWLGEGVALICAALLLRQGRLGDVGSLPLLVGVLLAGIQLLPLVGLGVAPNFPPFWQWLALVAGSAAALHALGLPGVHRPTLSAATLHPILVLFGLWFCPVDDLSTMPLLGGALALSILATLAATRLERGAAVFGALVGVAGVVLVWVVEARDPKLELAPIGAMLVPLAAAAFFTAWPYVVPNRFPGRWARRASALAGWAFFIPLYVLWDARWGDDAIGLLPIGLAVLPVLALAVLRGVEMPDTQRTSAIAWTATAAFGFLSVAVPLQLEQEWITVGWALEAVAVLVLWRRIDHPGLKYFALTLLAIVGARLLLNPEVLDYHSRGSMRIVNWLAYTYLVPAGAMFWSARLLGEHEVERARKAESTLYGGATAVFAGTLGLLGLAVVFAWMNLAVVDWFAPGNRLELDFSRLQARDLAFSIVWAAYAFGLLVLGVMRKSKVLRWASLGLLLVTLGKVFLYDLGELDDLYRVGSLVGLAISLIGVSLLYQRFVFNDDDGGGAPAPPADGVPDSEPDPEPQSQPDPQPESQPDPDPEPDPEPEPPVPDTSEQP